MMRKTTIVLREASHSSSKIQGVSNGPVVPFEMLLKHDMCKGTRKQHSRMTDSSRFNLPGDPVGVL